jgi:hypothetical protein
MLREISAPRFWEWLAWYEVEFGREPEAPAKPRTWQDMDKVLTEFFEK